MIDILLAQHSALAARQTHQTTQLPGVAGATPITQTASQLPPPELTAKENVHVRVHSFPHCMDPRPGPSNPVIGGIRSMHVGRLLAVAGTVVRTGAVRVFEAQKVHECTRCHHT